MQGKAEAMCEGCSGDKAEAFCRQCAEFICADCVQSHQKLRVFTGHKAISLDELKEGGSKDIVLPENPLKMCEKHDEKVKVYCFDCNSLICRDCTIKDHNGHNHEFIKEAAPVIKKELLGQLDPLKELREKLSHAVEEINIVKSEVKVQVDTATESIKNSFNELREMLANHEQDLLQEAATKGAQKFEKLSAQEKKLSTSNAVIQSVIEYTEQCFDSKHSTNDDVMSMRAEMQSRIKREVTKLKDGDGYKPVEEADMKVEINSDDLKQLFQTNAKLTQLPLKYTVTGVTQGSWARVNVAREVVVTAKLQGGKYNRPIHGLSCQVKKPKQQGSKGAGSNQGASGDTTNCSIKNKNDEYHIQYTPTVCGEYHIILTVGGQHVAGSPFCVNVRNY